MEELECRDGNFLYGRSHGGVFKGRFIGRSEDERKKIFSLDREGTEQDTKKSVVERKGKHSGLGRAPDKVEERDPPAGKFQGVVQLVKKSSLKRGI